MTEIRFLYVTTGTLEEARKIGETLVAQRLAACANIFPQMESIYHWENKIERSQEVVLILKTKSALVDEATQTILKLHSYETPCVLTIPIESGSNDYVSWLRRESK